MWIARCVGDLLCLRYMPPMSERRIPCLVVSGFLGSGKTTLVRALLDQAQAEGARVAFISNELGELGVDQAMLGGGEEAFVELAGGCVCCALNDELYETLIALKEQVDPDRIVIETSGVAIPHDVQITFWQPPICEWVSEEAVVVVVNAEQLHEGRDLRGTFEEQMESADLIVLHKVDLVSGDAIPGLKEKASSFNPGTPTVSATFGQVDPVYCWHSVVRARRHRKHVVMMITKIVTTTTTTKSLNPSRFPWRPDKLLRLLKRPCGHMGQFGQKGL